MPNVSPLATYVRLTHHCDKRNHKIDTITPHIYVGQVTAKQGVDYFAKTDREASANYIVGYDGSIGCSVDEDHRSWCSNSASNDHRAVTIEVACDKDYPYAITDKAYDALVDLCADICRRNHIPELRWKADKRLIGQVNKQNMTCHKWFASTACPGKYLYDRFDDIARDVNKQLKNLPDTPIEWCSVSLPEVHPGDRGIWVRVCAALLKYGGWRKRSVNVFTYYDKKMESEVRAFRRSMGLSDITGIGSTGWAYLIARRKKPKAPSKPKR